MTSRHAVHRCGRLSSADDALQPFQSPRYAWLIDHDAVMEPTILRGSIVIADQAYASIPEGAPIVGKRGGQYAVARLLARTSTSLWFGGDNPASEPVEVPVDEVEIVGPVVATFWSRAGIEQQQEDRGFFIRPVDGGQTSS